MPTNVDLSMFTACLQLLASNTQLQVFALAALAIYLNSRRK